MKKLTGKIDPSIMLAFHNLLYAMQKGHTVFLLSNMDMCAYSAILAYLEELQSDERTDKEFLKRMRSLEEEFAMQRLASITYVQHLPYPQEIAKSRCLLRKLIKELQAEKQGER